MEQLKTTALVLSGGGAKGAFQAGVLEVLTEQGYECNVISGVSVGSLNGAMLATGQFEQMMSVWDRLTPEQVIGEQEAVLIKPNGMPYKYIEPLIIAPEQSLGSALDFDNKNVREMMETGRQRAREVLAQRNKTVA